MLTPEERSFLMLQSLMLSKERIRHMQSILMLSIQPKFSTDASLLIRSQFFQAHVLDLDLNYLFIILEKISKNNEDIVPLRAKFQKYFKEYFSQTIRKINETRLLDEQTKLSYLTTQCHFYDFVYELIDTLHTELQKFGHETDVFLRSLIAGKLKSLVKQLGYFGDKILMQQALYEPQRFAYTPLNFTFAAW